MGSAAIARPTDGLVRVFLNPASAADNVAVAAQGAGARIRVISMAVVALAANTVTVKSAATAISSGKSLAANGGFVLPPNEDGWYETVANEALNIALSAATAVGVDITYRVTT